HGKSTLVRALTGMEPDRWAEERRRGMTIDLGYAWTTLPSGAELAFVDVPGHQRFIGNMLAGVGPAAAGLFVVGADVGSSRWSGGRRRIRLAGSGSGWTVRSPCAVVARCSPARSARAPSESAIPCNCKGNRSPYERSKA